MSIASSDLKRYRSAVSDDSASNGGRMSSTEIVSGVVNNEWPQVSPAEQAAGVTRYRKSFFKIANADNLTAYNVRIVPMFPTPAADRWCGWPGAQQDVQSGISGTERKYGVGLLNATVTPGATSLVVAQEAGSPTLFINGDLICICNQSTPTDLTGTLEYVTISGTPSRTGDLTTINFTPALANGYSSSNSRVGSVYQAGTVATSVTSPTVTSSAGTFNNSAYPIVGDNLGSVYQVVTLTFTAATTFFASGDVLGSLGSGSTLSNFAPVNADFGTPFFTVDYRAFGGAFTAGDTLVFTTTPAAIPWWDKLEVPASTNPYAGDFCELWCEIQTA